MEISKSGSKSSWFWGLQIAVGSLCLLLSVVILFYGIETPAGAYIWLFLAGIGLITLGAERLASGLLAKGVKRSSRLLNIGVGVGLIIYIGSGFFYPEFATKWLIIFLGFGLLANGVIRIVTGLKKKEEESDDVSSIALGLLITALAILVLVYPKLGVVLLLVMTIIALDCKRNTNNISRTKGQAQGTFTKTRSRSSNKRVCGRTRIYLQKVEKEFGRADPGSGMKRKDMFYLEE